jgi:hypothetical protein
MFRLPCTLLFVFLIGTVSTVYSDESSQGTKVPVFEWEFSSSWTGGIIQTDNSGAVPEAVDWNGDGKKDLLVGVYFYGNIYYYKNYGTNDNPAFQDRVKLEADGKEISLSYG